ncbi:MAG: hypothetical protein JWL82_177 [Parcubacteria group bacterium]|nr:hypothetical protein [Parcubacteria group bacterium]
MRLLIYTQIMDRADPALGFFVPWVAELAKRTDGVDVVCLLKGEFELPEGVRVHSLGKERSRVSHFAARLLYVIRFYKLLIRIKGYDAVLIHMNEEYVLLGGLLWRLMGKRVYLWRNHYNGSWKTAVAVALANKVFCTSAYSYTARFKRVKFMPVGVNLDSLNPEISVTRVPRSILFLARMDPSKRPELLLAALHLLKKREIGFTATFVGGPTEDSSTYPEEVAKLATTLGISADVRFTGAVPNTETFRYYRSHEIFVNASRSGMLDKTTFKAMAAGSLVLSSSLDLKREVSDEFYYADGNATALASKLEHLLSLSESEKQAFVEGCKEVVDRNTLPALMDRLVEEMQ